MPEAVAAPPPNSEAERRVVLDYIQRVWSYRIGEAACEDAVSDAYEALLERERAGEILRNRIRWLRTAAWRAANDELKRGRRQRIDSQREVARLPGADLLPEEHVGLAETDARLRVAFQTLPEDLRLAYASRHTPGLSADEASRRLGWPRSTLMHRRARALEELCAVARGTSERFERTFLSMAAAVVTGAASRDDRRRLRELVSKSPYYAARFAEIKRIDGKLGALVPPLSVEPSFASGVAERTAGLFDRIRESLHHVVSRSPETVEHATSPLGASGGKAGGAVAGGVGGLLGIGGGAAKLALTCGGAAAAAACVAAVAPGVGVPGFGGAGDARGQEARPASELRKAEASASSIPAVEVLPSQVGNDASAPAAQSPTPASQPSDGAGQESEQTAGEPVAAQEAETADFSFGTDSEAARAAPAPAPAPTSSGGGGSSEPSGGGGGTSGGDFAFGQ